MKSVKRIMATAMAFALAVPSTLYVKTTTVEAAVSEEALASYNFEDGFGGEVEGEKKLKLENGKPVIASGEYVTEASEALPEIVEDDIKGKVLSFKDSEEVEKYQKTESDELDDKYPVNSYIEYEKTIGGRVKVKNPFAGMKFDESKEDCGVTISYWVKVPVDEDRETKLGSTGANSTTVVFNNDKRLRKNKDDMAKWLACKEYDRALAANDEKSLKDYSLGKQQIATDAEGKTYNVYSEYGKLIRFNPNYPLDTTATVGGGWYVPENQKKDGKINVTLADGTKTMIASLANGTTVDQNQYDLFRYSYAEKDDFENGFSSKSKIREEIVKGSLQITTDNDFGFREDNYYNETYTDEAGQIKGAPVAGAIISNPNSTEYGQYQNIAGHNQFFFDGDELVTAVPEKWHYVTMVIQNDWVTTYVDGVPADPEVDYGYIRDEDSGTDFSSQNAGKMFNRGKGLRGVFAFPASNVADWSASGIAADSPANSLGCTMMEWISDPDTELFFGGAGYSAVPLTQKYGTVEGVCIDDISFFAKALSEDEALELYDEVKGAVGTIGDVDGDGSVKLIDAQMALKLALKIPVEGADKDAADINSDGKVDLSEAQKILKVALKLDSF